MISHALDHVLFNHLEVQGKLPCGVTLFQYLTTRPNAETRARRAKQGRQEVKPKVSVTFTTTRLFGNLFQSYSML